MRPWGMTSYLQAASVDPFNVFQNTPDYSLKDLGCSRAGDFVEFEVLGDCVVGVSACPYDVVSLGFSFFLFSFRVMRLARGMFNAMLTPRVRFRMDSAAEKRQT